MKRTTIFADEEIFDQMRQIAASQTISLASSVREAMKEYVSRHQVSRPGFSFLGIGQSAYNDTFKHVDDLLWQESRTAKLLKKRKKS